MIRIHPTGYKIIIFSTIILMSLEAAASMILPLPYFLSATLIVFILFALILRFFRIPKRIFEIKEGEILAPADGKIVAIETVHEDEYFKDERIVISIFMSIHNIHINWFPISGTIKYFKYHPGKNLIASHPKSSMLNEHSSIVIKNERNEILVRQIAGYVARRIVCFANPGRDIKQTEEMGFIKFGSRLDVYLPTSSKINVKIGDTSIGGITTLASNN